MGGDGDVVRVCRICNSDRTDEVGQGWRGFKTLSQIFKIFGNFLFRCHLSLSHTFFIRSNENAITYLESTGFTILEDNLA
jgi:hypothetical protein